ncbi:hypothetical protein ACJX0J_031907 [Zea mays]
MIVEGIVTTAGVDEYCTAPLAAQNILQIIFSYLYLGYRYISSRLVRDAQMMDFWEKLWIRSSRGILQRYLADDADCQFDCGNVCLQFCMFICLILFFIRGIFMGFEYVARNVLWWYTGGKIL